MASGGAEEDDGGIPLDIDHVHMLLQVEHEQIQKRTFTNWINFQLAKRSPPSFVSDLFSDIRDGPQLLDLLEVMSGQPMKRQRGQGLFQQRANIETALSFLRKKSIKLVNINISDVIDGNPSIILGLTWTIILHCHIEELASTLSFSSRHSSLDSLTSLDSWSGSPVPASPVPPGRTSPLYRRFKISAKKALLMWVRDQCQRVGSSVNVKDFKSSWRSGEAFLAILCSLRPQLVDLSLVQSKSNLENLEEAFYLAERDLHIPRLLEPQDVDVKDPDEKSIMTYVAQFLQYSNDLPGPDDHLQLFPLDQPFCFSPVNLPLHFTPAASVSAIHQVSPGKQAQEMTCWLQQAYQELTEAWEKSNYAEKYQVFQSLVSSFTEQRRPVMTHLAAMRHCPELSQEQHALRTAWDRLEEELQRCKTDLDLSLPPPLNTVVVWLQCAEAELGEGGGGMKDHADAAKEARARQDTLKTLIKEMSHHIQTLDGYHNMDDSGNIIIPPDKLDEIKRRVTHIRVTAKYQGIKLEYQEACHTALDLLKRVIAKVQTWKAPYTSKEAVHVLLQDWQETVERQGMLFILTDALQKLKEKGNAYTSKAALSEDSQLVTHQVKEAESEAERVTQVVMSVRGTMERMASAWETYNSCHTSLQTWLEQTAQAQTPAVGTQDMNQWASCQAKLNETGNFLVEMTDTSTSNSLAKQLSKVNMQWAECIKRTKFEVSSQSSVSPVCPQMVYSLTQEATWLLRRPLEVASVPLKANRQKLQLLRKKMVEQQLSSLSPSPDFQTSYAESSKQTLPQMLAAAESTCGELQRAASRLEGRLAELHHWSTDALDCYQCLKEKKHRGSSALDPTAKVLISRGLQLESQVLIEGQDLQALVARVQKTSPLCCLSTSNMQDRILDAVAHCQEIIGMFSSLGFKRRVGEPVHQTPETGLFLVARSKQVDQVGNVKLQTQEPSQLCVQIPSHAPQQSTRGLQGWPKTQHMNTQGETTTVIPPIEIQMLPQYSKEPEHHFDSVVVQTPVGLMPAVPEEKEWSPCSETRISKPRIIGQPNTLQSNKASPQKPIMVHSEVHSKAQSMARSRLEKARFRLQGRMQQAIKLFGGKETSVSQAKKKQKALKILQPSILQEFLDAVEGFGAFCSGPQLQDLMFLSDSVRRQWEAATEGAASIEEHVESLQELRETLTPSKSSCLAPDQLDESSEGDTVAPADGRGEQLGGNPLQRATGMSVYTHPGNIHLPVKQSVDIPQPDFPPVAGSVQLHGDILPLGSQNVPLESMGHLQQHRGLVPGKNLKSSLQVQEQPLKAHLLHISSHQTRTHIQAVVRGDTVETKQDVEWTVIPEPLASPQEEQSSGQEVLERYRKSCLVFQSQLQKNKQHLEFSPHPVTIFSLQNQKKQLQTLKQETEALWFELDHQLSQYPHLMTSEVEREWEQLTREWRDQQIYLQNRMTTVRRTAGLMESADDQMVLITQKLDRVHRESIDITSLTLADPRLVFDLKEMDDKLQSEIKNLSEQSSKNERQQSEATSPLSLHPVVHNSVHDVMQLRQQLEKVHSAAQALDCFLATVREVKADIPALLANQEEFWAQESYSWQAAMQQRLQTAVEQSDTVDNSLKAAGLTLTMDGATVTCQDVVTLLFKHVVDVEENLIRARKRESKDGVNPMGKEQMQRNDNLEMHQTKTGEDSLQQGGAQEYSPPCTTEEESELEMKRSRLNGESDTKSQKEEEHKAQKPWPERNAKDERKEISKFKKEGEEKERLVQRRAALLVALSELKGAAEQLGLQEPSLPALQQRTRVLTELECHLADLHSELQHVQDAFSSGIFDESPGREVEDLWEETTKAVTERLDQCSIISTLLKRFQSVRGELSGTLQRVENTISEHASYMGKDNLQRLHTKVQETKAELNSLGDRVEEIRNICRQLHTHLRQIPECTTMPFESEAEAVMDCWLDISERTDCHLENLHLGLTLWDGVLQLGEEVESWAANKLTVFAQSPSFQTEDDIKTLQAEILAQEESMERFHQRATEIQLLLQNTDPPLELQVVETQMRKKIAQLKDLVSEAEDVYRQMVAAKGQIIVRMANCFSSLQNIQESLLTLRGSEGATVLAKLKELCWPVKTQGEQVESLLEDLHVLASIASPDSLQSLSADGIRLQEKMRSTQQLFSEVEEQTERNIQDLDRILQSDAELISSYMAQRQEACCRVEELQRQTAQIPTLFPWPGLTQRRQACLLARQLCDETESLQVRLKSLAEQRGELAELIGNTIWTDSSWVDLDTCWSGLMAELKGVCSCLEEGVSNEERFGQLLQDCHHKLTSLQERMSACQAQKESSAGLLIDAPALGALLQEASNLEKDLLQLTALTDLITGSSTAQAQANLSQEVSNLQNHKRELDASIRENLALFTEYNNENVQQVKEEVSCVQTALKDLAEDVRKLCGKHGVLPDTSQLKQQWCIIQDCDIRMTELAARVYALQKTGESSIAQKILPADVVLTVDTALKDLDSLRSNFLQKKQECAENTTNRMRQAVSQLQHWSLTARAKAPPCSQAVLDEGLCLQQSLHEVLSEKDFIHNCLGTEVSGKLEKCASDALSESTTALEVLSECMVRQGESEVEVKDLMSETFRSECVSQHSDLPDETTAMSLPTPLFLSATQKKNSGADRNDSIKTKGPLDNFNSTEPVTNTLGTPNMVADATKKDQTCLSFQPVDTSLMCAADGFRQTCKKHAVIRNEVSSADGLHFFKSENEQSSQLLASTTSSVPQKEKFEPLQENTTSTLLPKLPAAAGDITSLIGSPLTNPDNFHFSAAENVSNDPLPAITDAQEQAQYCKDINMTPKKVFTIFLDLEPQDMQINVNDGPDLLGCSQESELCDSALTDLESTEKSGLLGPESYKTNLKNLNLAPQSERFPTLTYAQEKEKCCDDINGGPKKVFTIVLQMEPQDMQQRETVGASTSDLLRCSQRSELCDAKLTDVSNTRFPEKESGSFTASIGAESDGTGLRRHCLRSQSDVSPVADSLSESTALEKKSTNAKWSDKENLETHEVMHNEMLDLSKSCDSGSECQLSATHATQTLFVDGKQEEVTDFCHTEQQKVTSVLCTEEGLEQNLDALTETQIPAGDNQQMICPHTGQSTGPEHTEMAEGENTEAANDLKHLESQHSKVSERQDTLLLKESVSKLPSPRNTGVAQGQPEIREGMEAERTADLGAGEVTGGSPCKSSIQDIFSEIQNCVKRMNIINRTPHTDLNWYLKLSPGEPEIRLVRTVQQVLACRYQPAQLDVTAMAKQLEEAEEYRRCVQDQVATMRSIGAIGVCDSNALGSAEGQWSAALLDASATVQVKAAQLEQVKQYHKQMKMARAFLEVLADEKEKMSLNALESSAVQADKLHALLQTMKLKKSMMEELLQLGSQLSVHLSDAESSGVVLAKLGDIQEEWRLLEGSIKRALRHASNSTSQFLLLMKEIEHLKTKLDALQKSILQSSCSKSDLEVVCLITDLKLCNQLYLHLQSWSDALVHFSLGLKEKDEIQNNLQDLGSLLIDTKRKLDISTGSCGSSSLVKINKQLQELFIWAKQAEHHISLGQKLALFPEEAHIQIAEMKKFQTDIFSRRSKMQVQFEEMKDVASDLEKKECEQVLKTLKDLYDAIADSLVHVLDAMKKNLQEREKLLSQLSRMDAWLAERHATRDPSAHVENVSKADVQKLESELESHKLATVAIESQLNLVEAMTESCKKIAVELSPGESRYLVNRLSGLWTELDGLLAHEKAISWELDELIHERTSSDEELLTIEASLKLISNDLEQQRFPLTQETLSTIAHLKHMLMEHQCQVQELQHSEEAKRSSLLYTIGELQDRCKTLSLNTFEQEKYVHLRSQMEESMDISKAQIQRAKDNTFSMDERFILCQTLLVVLPLMKMQCQEAGDQLEVIAAELYPSELNSERQRIHCTVETLITWEHSVTDDIRELEAKLLQGLQFSPQLPALTELFQRTRMELEGDKSVSPDEKAIDCALQRYWVLWRNMESGIRMMEGLGRKEKINLKNYGELYSLKDATMQECHLKMEGLSQARESLKDYQWAAQGAIGFLLNAEATFLSAPGGFVDCTEEQRQTQQALEALEDGFQAHISHLVELVPQQPCLSRPKTEQLHINMLSRLLVGRAVLEAQAKLRLESLQRCAVRQQIHRACHKDIQQHLSRFEAVLSECAAAQVTSYDKCVAQQKRATLLMEDLHSLAGKIEELRVGCPMQGCGFGKDGELGALWRCWVSLRRGVGLLMAHTEQRGEEWKDITTSMEQCCSFLATLQSEVPDSSTLSFFQEEPQELLAQAEMHQAGLEQEQQALASLEHRLEHALSLSTSQDLISPGPVGKTLVKIQENVRSLKERNLLVVAAVQAEEKEREHVQEQIRTLEKHICTILPTLEACSDPSKQQELKMDLSTQKASLQCVMESLQSRYTGIPANISRRLQDVQLSLQGAEDKLMENSNFVQKLAGQVAELSSGVEKVKMLLDQRSPTVNEAQNVLKRVWDELDEWHSRLMLLENEVQDLAAEQPDQAHILMDQLTEPLQLYQNTAQMAEQRTSFLSKIPACLQEFEDILYSGTCWLDEAQTWICAPCLFTTARSLQSHANSLQLVLDDSERIRESLQDFRPVLVEISAVSNMTREEERLDLKDQQIQKMQCSILEPLEKLLKAVAVVEGVEVELKTIENNVPKIRTILSSMENSNITTTELAHNQQVILANVQSMRRTLEEMDRCKAELHLPQGAEENLVAFTRARLLLQQLEELGQVTQQQVSSLLEKRIQEEERTNKDLGITVVSDPLEEQLDRAPQRQWQGTFEASNSEEEEDEDDESCHSSSSDTLTCSIPEDPEKTLNISDVLSEDIDEIRPLSGVKKPEVVDHVFSPVEVKTSSNVSGPGLLSVNPGFDNRDFGSKNVKTGDTTMDSKDDISEAFSPTTVSAESLITADAPATRDKFSPADILEHYESPKHEILVSDPHAKSLQAAAAVEDTRLIPVRPITPFAATRTSTECIEGDEALSLSTANHQHLDSPSGMKERIKVSTSHSSLDESQAAPGSFRVSTSFAGHDDGREHQRWTQLYSHISQKLTTLKKTQEEYQTLTSFKDGGTHDTVPERELVSTGSASAVLHRTHESITTLRHTVRSADSLDPTVKQELYEAVRSVLLCLDSLTDLLLTPGGTGEDDLQLRLLMQECVTNDVGTLAELLNKMESENRQVLLREELDALRCLTYLQDCLQTVQLLFTSSHNQLLQHLGLKNQYKELSSNPLCILEEFDLGQREISLKDASSLEQCVLGRHLRESPGGRAMLQQASQSLLQGITHLLDLGEERITRAQMSLVPNCSELQAILCGHKKPLQVLGSQLAFVQHLFQREPETLKSQEDERVQLEVRAKALWHQALEQQVASQKRLREWSRWEDNCDRLSRVLDESEAFLISGESKGDDEEFVLQQRLDACQQTLVQLDESRATLGLLLDQRKVLQAEPVFAASVSRTGGALELRWRSAYRQVEQESQRCKDIQDYRARFQAHFASVSEWLVGANKHLKTLSDLADTSDLSQRCIYSHLIKLLDLSMEVEAMSVQRASLSKAVTQLNHLREAGCGGVRAQLTQLDDSWSQLSSDLSKIQDKLQQPLLAAWPPLELLSDLDDWSKKFETRLSQEKETALKAKDAAQITEVLQHCQELKAGLVRGQLLLDFLCQSGPQAEWAAVQVLRTERTMFAETLGALRLQWLHLQGDLENQICGVEQMHQACANRERQLQHLHGWIELQKKQLNEWKRLNCQTLVQKALQEWEAAVGRVRKVAAASQELKATQVHVDKEEPHTFSNQAETVSHACGDLTQQMEALRPALQQTLAEWSCYDRDLSELNLQTTRLHCALQHQQAPLFSQKQAEGYMHLLQELLAKAREAEGLWTGVENSYERLTKTLHDGTAQALSDQMEGQRKQWKDMLQELKDEHVKTGETVSLWQEYNHLFDTCSSQLGNLWHQWEELSGSSFSPEQDTQAVLYSIEKLLVAAEVLHSSVGDVLAASKPLIGRLEPLAANLIQSETKLLSREVLLLSRAMSGKKKSLEEDLEEQKRAHTCLEVFDKQMQNIRHQLEVGLSDTDSTKVLLELSGLFPSLADVWEMRGYVTINNPDRERLHALSGEWIESMTLTFHMNRGLQAEHQHSQNFQEKLKNLVTLQEKLKQELVSVQPQSYSSLQDMMTAHQRLQAEIIMGQQLLQGVLCDAVISMENEVGEKRSEVLAQVSGVKESWFNSVAMADQCTSLVKEQLHNWRTFRHGLKLLWKLLRNADPLLPCTGPAPCGLQQLRSCVDDYQCVEEALALHSTAYTKTLEAGRRLCETMTESESRSQLQSECQAIEEAWQQTTSLLRAKTELLNATVQKWSKCQDGITNIMSELDELKTRLKPQLPERLENSEEQTLIQETELSLHRLDSGLRELATMKTDLSQYIAAGDSALLEQQLEQLHSQWEELCMKVSLRRQEIADRLNAWTIFNDKNKELCDWLTQMENKVCHSGDLSIEEMVEKLKKDCMEEINLFSENKSHLKQLGEQLLLASDEAKQTKIRGSLQEVSQRWHNLFHLIEARVKKLKETLVTVQQLDKNMSNLRSWLSRIEAELSRPITYSVCHHQEIQRRLAEQQELQRDIEQHTEGVASVLSLCDVLLRDEDAAGGPEAESDSLQETSRSLDQRWRTICTMALDRRLRIEETWKLWCKFLDDYSRFEDWLKMAEHTAANPNSADVLYTVAKEECKKFEGFQRQVHERLTELELINNQYRRLARENRTDRASQLKAMVREGNRRWDTLHRRVSAILRRLKYFTSQREEFEGTRESMLVWLTELDLQLTNVEHFSESDIHHKIQQLNSFQKEITLNTERIDGLIVFGECLIQKSSAQDAALIEDELEELHSYCQEVFSRLVRFHQRLSQPLRIKEEPELFPATFSLESSLELIGRPWLGRSQGSLPATPTHLLASPLERSGRETPVSVDSLPLEWDHTGDVGGSSSHEDGDDEEEEEEHEEEDGAYYNALSELTEGQDEFIEAMEAVRASSLVPIHTSPEVVHESPSWQSAGAPESQLLQLDSEDHTEAAPTSTPLKQGYLRLMSQCSGSIEDIKRVSLILDDEEQPEELGLTGLAASDKQSGVIERWELLQAQSRSKQPAGPQEPQQLLSDLDDITSWMADVMPELDHLQQSDPAASIEDMEARAKELKDMQRMFCRYKSVMLSINLRAQEAPEVQHRLRTMNRDWSRACTGLQQWDISLRKTLMRCQEFHKTLHSLLLWLAHAESRRYALDISDPDTSVQALQQHHNTLADLQAELRDRQAQQASLQALWSQLQPDDRAEESNEAQEKLHVTGSKLKLLLREVDQDLSTLRQRLGGEPVADASQEAVRSNKGFPTQREKTDAAPPRSFFHRVLRAAFPLHLLLLLLLLLPCLIPLSESEPSCTVSNNFARSFYPMLHYTNGPPPT
ncbi:nesprin-2a isoform X2 [Mastacembelus armatus]|uniref:nesprin-2a isoform X2 n=1 Tax=Mastacembelus armatus TaxID=205130 RepID=UPI000E45D4C1|nr:nesprin-2-like isoform X2 [Mastacembelus armatus]